MTVMVKLTVQHDILSWTPSSHSEQLFSCGTNILFATLLLGVQRLEETGVLPLAHQAMLEDMLEGWTGRDDKCWKNTRVWID